MIFFSLSILTLTFGNKCRDPLCTSTSATCYNCPPEILFEGSRDLRSNSGGSDANADKSNFLKTVGEDQSILHGPQVLILWLIRDYL